MAFELTILGCNSALPTANRYPTAQVLEVPGRCFLIDCGEGAQMQIRRNKISFNKIQRIFISHLHGDHYFGLIGLISSMNLMGLKKNLHIHAPIELESLLQAQLNFIKGEMLVKPVFHPLNLKTSEIIFEDKKIEVTSFPLKHSMPTCGFLFKEKTKKANIKKDLVKFYNIPIAKIKEIKAGSDFVTSEGKIIANNTLTIPPPPPKSYAFCSDTAYFPTIVKTIKDVDLLYHESTFLNKLEEFANKTLHSTAKQAAEIAKLANAKKLIIGHYSARFKDSSEFLQEAKEVFENTEATFDGAKYEI
jgi:ribonuclease Z